MKYDAPKEFKILSTILTSNGGNSTYPKVAVQCSADTFVVKSRPSGSCKTLSVILKNTQNENKPHKQTRNSEG
jgi:hypothetical protein